MPVLVRNARLSQANLAVGPKRFRLSQPLRLVIEDFGGDGVLVYLVSDRTFVGFGETEQQAVSELMTLITHDLGFYDAKADEELTGDALASKMMLQRFFAVAD